MAISIYHTHRHIKIRNDLYVIPVVDRLISVIPRTCRSSKETIFHKSLSAVYDLVSTRWNAAVIRPDLSVPTLPGCLPSHRPACSFSWMQLMLNWSKLQFPVLNPCSMARYAVTELVESEREYVRDLKKLLDSYYKRLGRRSTPSVLKDKRDLIFSNINDIMDFHTEWVVARIETVADSAHEFSIHT